MNRIYLSALGLLAAAMPMVMDSALKGAALLTVAAVAALVLWRASAAARHLVWLVAVLALLLVPVLSVVLPSWRVLPAWAVAPEGAKGTERTQGTERTAFPVHVPHLPDVALPEQPALRENHVEDFPGSFVPSVPVGPSGPTVPPATSGRPPVAWLPLAWSAGCTLLLLRLFSAHWLLRRASRRCQAAPEGRLTSALANAAQQLGVRQRIRFLMDEKRTIPVVWGVIWPRLILPAEALRWDEAKLRSVLLHELAHIRRRDTLVQWLTQLACALHWFNPLVWLAAWRLHTERERACDDLVLASGVKASAYAGHLLEVASKLTPARWTAACGLAMARKSSLESRLRAVLSGNLNRCGVTRLLALASVVLTAAVVVPLAMLRAADKAPVTNDRLSGLPALDPQTSVGEIPLGDPALASASFSGSVWSQTIVENGRELRKGTESMLRWGPIVNGLRAALLPLPNTSKFTPGDVLDFNLVLQNVSLNTIQISTESSPSGAVNITDPTGRMMMRNFGRIVCGGAICISLDPGKVVFMQNDSVGISKAPPSDSAAVKALPSWNKTLWLSPDPSLQVNGAKSIRGRYIGSWCPPEPMVTFSATFSAHDLGKPGSWSGTVVTGQTPSNATPLQPDLRPSEKPKSAEASVNAEPITVASKSLFNHWKSSARADGKIPGGCIGQVAASLKTYMDLNEGTEAATKCEPVFKKCDATHDWTQADAAALLDEIDTVAKDHAAWTMRAISERQIHPGKPLLDELKDAPWGTPADNGLRMAWLCGTGLQPMNQEPAANPPSRTTQSSANSPTSSADGLQAHPTQSILTSRVLFHNTGKAPVCFATEDWIQSGTHTAKDAAGRDITIHATQRLGHRTRMIFRLAPGQYAEVVGHGIGIGSHEAAKEKTAHKVGAWIEAKEGDVVTFTPGKLLVSFQTWQNNEGRKDSETVWNEMITARVAQEGPWPHSVEERELLLKRIQLDLGIVLPYDEAKVPLQNDDSPDCLAKLTTRLREAGKDMHYAGELAGGETKFTVTAATKDPSDQSVPPDKSSSNPPAVEADLGGQQPAPQCIIQIRQDGTYVIQKEELTFKQLEERLVTLAAAKKPQPIIIRSDKATPYDRVIKVLEACRKAGLHQVSLGSEEALLEAREALQADLKEQENKLKKLDKALEETNKAQERNTETLKALGEEQRKRMQSISLSQRVVPINPKHEYAQALFKQWRSFARADGKIPGALIGHVAEQMDGFLKQYPTDSKAAALAAVRPRLDATRDWTPEDVVALMNDITEISTAPISWASTPMEFAQMNKLLPGKPLPEELQKANWGKPAANGLRAAYLLAPSATEYPLNSVLKARVLFHNTGTAPVIFRTETWHQNDKHRGTGLQPVNPDPASNPQAAGAPDTSPEDGLQAHPTAINITSTWFTGMTPIATYRLAPGEYAEVPAHGIAIGAGEYKEEHSTASVGAVIEATAGQTVRFSTEVNAINEGWTRPNDPKDPTELYLKNIANRIALEAPLPKSTADRELLIIRATQDLFGQPPTEAEVAMFTTDVAPDALEKLTDRLQAKPRPIVFSGNLQTGETTFKVLPADPNAAIAPRTATGPGRYVLGDNVHLQVTQTTEGDKRTNKATILFLSPDPKVASPHKPYEIELPEGVGTFLMAWERGSGVFWVAQKGTSTEPWSKINMHKDNSCTKTYMDTSGVVVVETLDPEKRLISKTTTDLSLESCIVSKIDFSNPAQVIEAKLAPGPIERLPEEFRKALATNLSLVQIQDHQQSPVVTEEITPQKHLLVKSAEGSTLLNKALNAKGENDFRGAESALRELIRIEPTNPIAAGLLKKLQQAQQRPQGDKPGGIDHPDAQYLAKIERIVLPRINLRETSLHDSIQVLRDASIELDSDKEGINFILAATEDSNSPKVTVEGTNFPLLSAVRSICEQTGLSFRVNRRDILIRRIPPLSLESRAFKCLPNLAEKFTHGRARRINWLALGLPELKGSSLTYLAGSQRIIISSSMANLDVLEVLVEDDSVPENVFVDADASGKKFHQPTPAQMNKRITVSVKAMRSEEPVSTPPVAAEMDIKDGKFALTGVLTQSQLAELMDALNKQKPNALTALPDVISNSHEVLSFVLPKELGGSTLGVSVALNADGETMDISVGSRNSITGGLNPDTICTLWDGQTLRGHFKSQDKTMFVLLTLHLVNAFEPSKSNPASMLPAKPQESSGPAVDAPNAPKSGATSSPAGHLKLLESQIYTGEANMAGGTLRLSGSGSLSDTPRPIIPLIGTGTFDIIGISAPTEVIGSAAAKEQPTHAQALLKFWSNAMRMNGQIPGGLIGKLAENVRTFIKRNPTWATTQQLQALLPRLDATHDWSGQDAVALLDELSALQETPIKMALEQETQHVIRTGMPLPAELAKAPWGETLANGLRHAWMMEPNAVEYALETALKARALIHNAGKEPVTFRTRTWHQLGHKATDAKGAELETESVDFMTRGILLTYRLAPGEFIEVNSPGIGLGKMGQVEKEGIAVGTWIQAQAGEEVTISTTPIPLMDWNEDAQLKLDGEPRWWLDYIRARLARHLPFPDEQKARERLLYRVAMELFGTPVSAEITAVFVADKSPKALETLAELLFHRQGQQAWAGPLQSGVVKLRVTAADEKEAQPTTEKPSSNRPETSARSASDPAFKLSIMM
jgi:beta-lactamase regulating signal transducer with metallopeptidase domain/biopolymer transport protein ExbD